MLINLSELYYKYLVRVEDQLEFAVADDQTLPRTKHLESAMLDMLSASCLYCRDDLLSYLLQQLT